MRATKSSKPSPAFSEYALVALLLTVFGVAAAAWSYANGYTLYYGDAEAHLNIARRIADSRTPGYEQIGTTWLPLPHLLMMPFVRNQWLWQTGLAGTIPGVACFVFAGVTLFATARLALGSFYAGLTAALLFGLNPNLLYLQSTPMTEPVFFAALLGLLFFSLNGNPIAAGLCSIAASLTRYEGWFLIPFVCIYLWRRSGLRAGFTFGAISSLAPLYWLGHNTWIYANPLEFYNGPYSAMAYYRKALAAGVTHPGDHDWVKAVQYFAAAATLNAGAVLSWLGLAGALAALVKRAFWPVFFLSLGPAFYVLSIYSSGTPIFIPTLYPFSYYNVRYGLAFLPLAAFGVAALVSFLPEHARRFVTIGAVIAVLLPWLFSPAAVCWEEARINSEQRRAWTGKAAEYLKVRYRNGDGILFPFGDMTGVLRAAGLPLREGLHEGNGPHFTATLVRPDLFLWEEWVIAVAADPVSTALLKLGNKPFHYERVKIIEVKDAPPLEIYRRWRAFPNP